MPFVCEYVLIMLFVLKNVGPMHQRQVANATTAVSRQMPLMQVPRASGVARPHLLVCNRQKEMKMKWGISFKRSQKWKLLL